MPESVGKRQRRDAKQKKAVTREERRVARNQRREDRAAGLIEPGTPIEESEDLSYLDVTPLEPAAEPQTDRPAQSPASETPPAPR
jgi:hypothetical protein